MTTVISPDGHAVNDVIVAYGYHLASLGYNVQFVSGRAYFRIGAYLMATALKETTLEISCVEVDQNHRPAAELFVAFGVDINDPDSFDKLKHGLEEYKPEGHYAHTKVLSDYKRTVKDNSYTFTD